jgi:hypothetical protein
MKTTTETHTPEMAPTGFRSEYKLQLVFCELRGPDKLKLELPTLAK